MPYGNFEKRNKNKIKWSITIKHFQQLITISILTNTQIFKINFELNFWVFKGKKKAAQVNIHYLLRVQGKIFANSKRKLIGIYFNK